MDPRPATMLVSLENALKQVFSEVYYSEKRSYKNSINFFKQRFTWCKSHPPPVNCQPD